MNQAARHKSTLRDFSPPGPVDLRDADLDLTAVLRLIRRRVWFIGALTIALTLMALPLIMMIEPLYRAEARFLIQPPFAPDPAIPATAFDLDDEVQRVRARANADRVVQQFDLKNRREFNTELPPQAVVTQVIAALKSVVLGDPATPPLPSDIAAAVTAAFYDRLTVWRQTDSIMQISFVSTDPKLAADVTNAMIDAYIANRRARHEARIEEAQTLIDARIGAQQSRVDAANETVRRFQETFGVTSAGRVEDIQTNRLVLLNEQLADLHNRQVELRGKVASVDAALAGTGPAPLNETDALIQLRQTLQQEQSELTRLRTRFGDGFGGVQTQKSRIAATEAAIRMELQAWGQSLKVQLAQFDDQEAQLAANGAAAQGDLSKSSIAEMQLADLVQQANTQAQILETLEAQKTQLDGLRKQSVFDLELLEPATEPTWPEGRSRKIYLLVAIFASSVAALTLAGVLDLTDRTVRSHQQLLGEPGMVPVGMLTETDRRDAAPGQFQRDKRQKDALRGILLAIENDNGGTLPLSLMVTSARPHEGACFVAHGLADEMLNSGHNVLIVDAMTPQDRVSLRRNQPMPPGLAEYLRNEMPLSDLIASTDRRGMSVLHRGNGPLPHLNDSQRIERLIDHAAAFGLLVVLICPPVLTNTSVLRIAAAMNRVLLVARWGVTPRDSIHLTAQRLRAGHVDRVMTLLNRVNPRQHALYAFGDGTAFSDHPNAQGW